MKRFITLLMMVLLAGFAMAQTPQKLSYQAVVRNSANQLVVNQPVTVTVDITDAAGSTNYYSETHSVTTNPNGLISLMVGEGTPVSGKMSDVIWWDAAIKTTIDVTGTKIENTTLVTAVPYALHADSARTVNREVLNEQIHEVTDQAISNLNIRISRTNVRVDSIGKKLTDTLKYYVSAQALADTAGAIRIWVSNTIHDSLEVFRQENQNIMEIVNNLSDRVDEFNLHVCDSVAACLNTSSDLQDALNQFLSDHHVLTSDSTLIQNMLTDITNLQTNVTNLENKLNDFKVNVCDSVAKCIGGDNAITEAITNVTENYLGDNNFLTKDSTTIINIQNDITNLEGRVNEFNINVCDSVAACLESGNPALEGAITNVTKNYLEEKHYLTKDSTTTINNITEQYLETKNYLTKDSTTIINIQNDITNLENRVDEFNLNVCDSVAKCIEGNSNITNAITNVTKEYLEDKGYLTKDSTTTINNITNQFLETKGYLTSDSTIIKEMKEKLEGIEAGAEANVQSDWNVTDATSDAYILNKPNIKDSVNSVLTENNYMTEGDVANYLTTNNFLTKDSSTITNIQNDITNLENRVNEFNINVCDSVAACLSAGGDLKDTITKIINNNLETKNYLTSDSTIIKNMQTDITNLENRVNEFNINVCDSVAKCIGGDNGITNAITNVTNEYLGDHNFLTKDSTTIQNIENKLSTIQENAEENVQSDWNVTDAASDAFILNKPNIKDSVNQVLTENKYVTQEYLEDKHYLTKDSITTLNQITQNYLTENNYMTKDSLTKNNFLTKDSVTITNMQTAIENLEGAEENVQADWNVTDNTSDAFIKNKPSIKDSVDKVLTDNHYVTEGDVATYLTTNKYINEQALIDSNYVTEQALIDSNYVKTSNLSTEQSAKFSATAGQTAFTITSTPNAKYLVKIYINGILVGDNNTGVVTVSGTTVTYVPAQNEDYALEAGDKILIYWFK